MKWGIAAIFRPHLTYSVCYIEQRGRRDYSHRSLKNFFAGTSQVFFKSRRQNVMSLLRNVIRVQLRSLHREVRNEAKYVGAMDVYSHIFTLSLKNKKRIAILALRQFWLQNWRRARLQGGTTKTTLGAV